MNRAQILAFAPTSSVRVPFAPSAELRTMAEDYAKAYKTVAFDDVPNFLSRDGDTLRKQVFGLAVRYARAGKTTGEITMLFAGMGFRAGVEHFGLEDIKNLTAVAKRYAAEKAAPQIPLLPEQIAKYDAFMEVAAKPTAEARMPAFLSLQERLALPARPKEWRLSQIQQVGHRVVLVAQYKSGKTTMVGNLVRSLVDGDPFLDTYDVSPIAGTVAVLDFEMLEDGRGQLDDWYRDLGIRNSDRVLLIPMRGRASSFDIRVPSIRAEWAAKLRERKVEYLGSDCLRPVLDTLGLSENSDAGVFLEAFDELLREAGIRDALVVHHMGHANERSRGDSRILDWPDVTWTLVRESDDPASPRFFKAFGRGVDVAETRLNFCAKTKRLGVRGGARKDIKAEAALIDVMAFVERNGETTANKVEGDMKGGPHARTAIRAAIELGKKTGRLVEVDKAGKGGGQALRLAGKSAGGLDFAGAGGVASPPESASSDEEM